MFKSSINLEISQQTRNLRNWPMLRFCCATQTKPQLGRPQLKHNQNSISKFDPNSNKTATELSQLKQNRN